MMNNNMKSSIFSPNMNQSRENNFFQFQSKNNQEEEKDISFNEDRLLNKLSLRKQKIENILSSKRNINLINTIETFNNNDLLPSIHEIIPYTKNDFISGDLYLQLKKAFDSKDFENVRKIVFNLVSFFNEKKWTILK